MVALQVRANGMAFYYKIIDPTRDRFPATPAPSRPGTPLGTPTHSRPPSPTQEEEPGPKSARSSISGRRRRHHGHHHHHSLFHPHGHHVSLFHEALDRSHEHAVGVFESQKYLNLETRMHHPDGDVLVERAMKLLAESSTELLRGSADALRHIISWLERMNSDRFWKLYGREREKSWKKAVRDNEESKRRLEIALTHYREKTRWSNQRKRAKYRLADCFWNRHIVLDPYRSAFDNKHYDSSTGDEPPPHRYLFQCYVYQYHLLQFSLKLCEMVSHEFHQGSGLQL